MAVKAEDILLFDRDAYNAKAEQGAKIAEDSVEEVFKINNNYTNDETQRQAKWVGL